MPKKLTWRGMVHAREADCCPPRSLAQEYARQARIQARADYAREHGCELCARTEATTTHTGVTCTGRQYALRLCARCARYVAGRAVP